ncbi:DUF2076 domain-containing protein [soil metagenome]
MTPQERQLVDDLFDRLSKVETAPRDRDAQDAISRGQQRAPNAVYALVQTVLLQDEALKRAHDRITELEATTAPEPAPSGGFLDSMRDSLFGTSQPAQRGSVPSVPPPSSRPAWNTGQVIGQSAQGGYGQPNPGYGAQPGYGQPQPQAGGGGGSFLGTAAAAAAGMVGGSLLLGSIRSMMGGGGNHSAFGNTANAGESKSPWSSDSSTGGDLAKDAGLNDIGSSGHRASAFDQAQADADQDQDQDQDDDDHDAMDMDSDDFAGDDDSSFA